MKIVFYSYDLNRIAGIEHGIILRANYFAARGHQVFILNERDFDKSRPLMAPLDSAVIVVGFSDLMHRPHNLRINLKGLGNIFKYFVAVDRWLKTIKPDVIISRGEDSCRTFHAVRHHGAAYVMEFAKTLNRNEFKPRLIDRIILKYLSFRVDKYVLLTHLDLNFFNGPQNKVVVINNPLYIKPKQADVTTNKVIVSTGRFHFEKNYEAMIEVFALVHEKHPDWKLHIYGEGDMRHFLQSLIDDRNLGDNAILMDRTNDVVSALTTGAIFALTSRNEGLPNSVLEAIACGLPIVVTELNGTHEIMDGHDVGFMVPQGNIEAFAERINYLIEHPEERVRLGENAINRSLDFDFETIMSRQERFLTDLVMEKQKN